VVASALRGPRYLYQPPAEPVVEELFEGAAESAAAVGLDESAGLPGLGETAALPGGNGNRNGAGAARRPGSGHNGVSAASASSGADTEFGSSSENN